MLKFYLFIVLYSKIQKEKNELFPKAFFTGEFFKSYLLNNVCDWNQKNPDKQHPSTPKISENLKNILEADG